VQYDVAVVGAGFGGLGTALELARSGARVALCEALAYPGGCASTFKRGGIRYESGATLFSGFDPPQLFGRWVRELMPEVVFDRIDPIVEHRTPHHRLVVTRDREELLAQFATLEGAPREGLARFFAVQRKVADALWPIFDQPEYLTPSSLSGLWWHAKRLPSYASLAPYVGRTLASVMAEHGVERFEPLRSFVDALCQITVQCPAEEAEAPFALAAMDYYHRGTGHVRGGVGALASAMVAAIERAGGRVMMANSVRGLSRIPGGFEVDTRRGMLRAEKVALNLLPQAALTLAKPARTGRARLERLAEKVEAGWGAVMLYLLGRAPEGAPDDAKHYDLVVDPALPHVDGNHLFVSISGANDPDRAPDGLRTLTVSTHVSHQALRALDPEAQATFVRAVQERLRGGLELLLPEWSSGLLHQMTASPRTFQRFTQRPYGLVGGIPRRAGLANYRHMGPFEVEPGLYLVGDSVFPGQSTLATAVGGARLATHLSTGLVRVGSPSLRSDPAALL
jgi:phytoene dehydrogenase-like protein